MKLDIRKTLLAGTAIVAVGGFIAPTTAHAFTATLTGDTEWGSAGPSGADGDGTDATAGDDAVMTTHALTFTNDTANDDGSADVHTFAAGDVTSTTGNLSVTDDSANNLAVTIGSFTSSSTGDFSVVGKDANTADVAATVGALTTGGNLAVTNVETSSADAISLSVGGALTVTGTTGVTAGAFAGATADLAVTGNATFADAVMVTAGAGAGSDATVTLSGATNTFTGGLTLTDGAAGSASLVLDGAVAQTVTGAIAGDGSVVVDNASGVTFAAGNTVTAGDITIEKTAGNSSATFKDDVTADITLGTVGNAGDENTITFDTSTADLAFTGAVATTATETNAVVVSGGNTVTHTGGALGDANLATLTVSGTGTVLTSDQNVVATAITVGSGAELETTGSTVTGAIANAGTVTMGGGDITGNITGAGTLAATADGTLTGSVANTVTIADNVSLTVDGTTGDEEISGTVTINDSGVDDGLFIDDQGNTITVSGAVKTGTTGQGLIDIADSAGTVAFTADVGTSAAKVGALTVNGGVAANTVTTTGDLYVDAITLNNADTLQFLGTSAQAVSGTITGGILAVGDATTTTDVTFGDTVSGVSLTVNDDAMATFDADGTFTGALSADAATVQVNAGKTLTAATQTDADVTTWNIGVDKAAGTQTNGTVIFTGDAANLAVDTVNFVVAAGAQPLTTGASVLDDVFQGNAAATIAGATVTDNSYMYGFELVADTNNVDVTVTEENSINNTAVNSANANVGNALMTTLAGSTNTQINQIQSNVAAASSAGAVNEVLEASHATVDGGHVVAGLTVASQSLGLASTRLASLRDGGETGMAAGSNGQGLKAWGQVFGQTSTQDQRDGIDGYDADTYGFAVGMDSANIVDGGVVGLAFSYGDTSVDSENANTTDTEVDTYQVTLYGDYDLDEQTYINGMIGYAWGEADTTRHNVGGVSGLTANGNFDSNQFIAQAELGRDYNYGDNMTLTPNVLAHYSYYNADDYTETGAGGANLAVDNKDLNVFELGLGVDASWLFENADGSLVEPEVRVGVRYDLIGDEVETTSAFTGAPTVSFNTQGFDPAQTTFNIGAGVKYYSTDNWDLTANYDFEVKEDYDSHAAFLRAAYKF